MSRKKRSPGPSPSPDDFDNFKKFAIDDFNYSALNDDFKFLGYPFFKMPEIEYKFQQDDFEKFYKSLEPDFEIFYKNIIQTF